MQPDVMSRLHAVNPFIVDAGRGQEPVAQTALQRILATPAPPASVPRRTMTPRGLALVVAVLLVGVGGALAATDPMGWWSNNPSQAHYRVNPTIRVHTPTAQQIRCHAAGGGHFNCTAVSTRCDQIGRAGASLHALGERPAIHADRHCDRATAELNFESLGIHPGDLKSACGRNYDRTAGQKVPFRSRRRPRQLLYGDEARE